MKPASRRTSIGVPSGEIAKFSDLASSWWDINGPMAPLHHMTPCRLEFIVGQINAHFGAIQGLEILDVGCGGGLVAEPLARLGARLTGIDAAGDLIAIAQEHAAERGLSITYAHAMTGDFIKRKKKFDVVLALEVIEHVSEPDSFVSEIAQLAKPGGLVIFSTLNRTSRSFALGIVAAEYILQWLPIGTHDWRKFIKPSELHRFCTAHGLTPQRAVGMIYHPLTKAFTLDENNLRTNYLLSAVKHGA